MFGAAALALLFVMVAASDSLSDAYRQQLLVIIALGFGGALVAAVLVSSAVAGPLERRVAAILEVARRYAVGDLRRPLPDYGDDEIGEVARALDGAVHQLGRRVDELSRDLGLAVLYISHDIATVSYICDQVAVMYLGQIVEEGAAEDILAEPLHPYTQRLMAAVPSIVPGKARERMELRGDVPSPTDVPSGCRFSSRCPFATELCAAVAPELLDRIIFSTGDVASRDASEFVKRTNCIVMQKPFELKALEQAINRMRDLAAAR